MLWLQPFWKRKRVEWDWVDHKLLFGLVTWWQPDAHLLVCRQTWGKGWNLWTVGSNSCRTVKKKTNKQTCEYEKFCLFIDAYNYLEKDRSEAPKLCHYPAQNHKCAITIILHKIVLLFKWFLKVMYQSFWVTLASFKVTCAAFRMSSDLCKQWSLCILLNERFRCAFKIDLAWCWAWSLCFRVNLQPESKCLLAFVWKFQIVCGWWTL